MLSYRAFFLRSCGLLLALVGVGVGSAWAQTGSGFYLSSRLGAHFAPKLNTGGQDSDRASRCDEFINPLYAEIPGCTAPNRDGGDGWVNKFDSTRGILAGAALGYRLWDRYPDRLWGRFRIEGEYIFRSSEYDQSVQDTSVGQQTLEKATGETESGLERIGSIASHNLFGNLYFDLINKSRFTPYVGLGAGVGFTDMDYGALYKRFSDPKYINTGNGYLFGEALAEYKNRLAGTATSEQAELRDTLFGYQVLFGVDYALTESVSLGVQGRWVNYESFRDGGSYDWLRSHESNLRLDGSEPVTYQIKTDSMRMFGVSVNLNYHF